VGLGVGVVLGVVGVLPEVEVEGALATSKEDFIPPPPPQPTTPKMPNKTARNLLSALRKTRKTSLQVGVPTRSSG